MTNNRAINMLEISRRMMKRILTHHIRSIQQAAMLERIDVDAASRALKTFSQLLSGAKLTEQRNNRLHLTRLSTKALALLDEFCSLGESHAEEGEKIRIAVSLEVPSQIVALVLSRFMIASGEQVSPEVVFASEGMRELVRCQDVAFGMDLCSGDSGQADERVAPPIPCVIAARADHRLATAGCIDSDHFSPNDRIYLAPFSAAKTTELLARVPLANRIEVADASLRQHLVALNAGIAIEYAFPSREDGFVRLPVMGVEPASLGLLVPKKRERMSEATQLLLDTIKTVVCDLALPPIPSEAGDSDEPLPEIPELAEPLSA